MDRYRVVIVEDEELILQSLIRMPKWDDMGFKMVVGAKNGLEGIACIEQINPHIVLTDVKMPFLDGIEMLERTIEKYNYKAIIISGFSEFAYAKKAISLGVSEYLLKPISLKELENAVKKALEGLDMETFNKDDPAMSLCKEYATKLLDDEAILKKGIRNRDVLMLLNYVKEHFSEKFLMAELSEMQHISPSYLSSKFKDIVGYSFNDYVNRYRMVQSIMLLATSDLKIYEVAQAVGFEDYKYFIMVFKKYLKISPAKFQTMLKNKLKEI